MSDLGVIESRSARRALALLILRRATQVTTFLAPLLAIAVQDLEVVPDWQGARETAVVVGLGVGGLAAVGAMVWLWIGRKTLLLPVLGSLGLAGWAVLTFLAASVMSFGDTMAGRELLQTVPVGDDGTVFLYVEHGFIKDRPRTRV